MPRRPRDDERRRLASVSAEAAAAEIRGHRWQPPPPHHRQHGDLRDEARRPHRRPGHRRRRPRRCPHGVRLCGRAEGRPLLGLPLHSCTPGPQGLSTATARDALEPRRLVPPLLAFVLAVFPRLPASSPRARLLASCPPPRPSPRRRTRRRGVSRPRPARAAYPVAVTTRSQGYLDEGAAHRRRPAPG